MAKRTSGYVLPDSVQISARTTGKTDARVLRIYVEALTVAEIEDIGISRANMVAHKRGYKGVSGEGVTVGEITRKVMGGGYGVVIEYTQRWRGRSL